MSNDTDLAKEIDKSEEEPVALLEELSPDEAVDAQYSKQPFRVIYQTNNFLLPQIRDLITDGDDVNLRPEYQRSLMASISISLVFCENGNTPS